MKKIISKNERVSLYKDNNKLLEMGFFADEFVIVTYTDEEIIIDSEVKELFNLLNNILLKSNSNNLVFISDIENDLLNNNSDYINRLIINKENNILKIKVINPYNEQHNITKKVKTVSFNKINNYYSDMTNIYNKLYNNNLDFLNKILLSENPSILIRENEEIIFDIIKELRICKGFNQNNPWHPYDVYEHILHVLDNTSTNLVLRYAALFHDIGKPNVYKEDENGTGHFYGHWDSSCEIFTNFANKYGIDDYLKNKVLKLIYYHDFNIDKLDKEKEFSNEELKLLLELKKADLLAQNSKFHYLLEKIKLQEKIWR
jgi:hypothetical protein